MYPLESNEDIAMRLDQSVIMFDGKAKYCTVDRRATPAKLHLTSLREYGSESSVSNVDLLDPRIEIGGFNIGYMNVYPINKKNEENAEYTFSAVFLSRRPDRQQKQGLSARSLHAVSDSRVTISMNGQFADMLENVYPHWKHALRLAQEKRRLNAKIAFSANFAIGSRGALPYLEFRGIEIGTYSPVSKAFSINADNPGISYILVEMDAAGIPYTTFKGGWFDENVS